MSKTAPDLDAVTLRIDSLGVELDRWTRYSFVSNFVTPADGFTFTIGDPDIPQGVSGKIRDGMKVTLTINGRPACSGVIDEVHADSDRSGGTTFDISGRDILGDVVDTGVDPSLVFQPTQQIGDILKSVLGTFGITNIDVDNDANKSLITGNKYGYRVNKTHVSKRGKVSKGSGAVQKKFAEHQSKPYPQEGAYEFIERLAKREGFHLWAKADGTGVVLGKPDFDPDDDESQRLRLIRRRGIQRGSGNNVDRGRVARSRLHQPSVIVAGASSGGGDFGRTRIRCIMVNELIARDATGAIIPGVRKILDKYSGAYVIGPADLDGQVSPLALNPYPICRPLYLVDQEARDLNQLKNFVKREMAKYQQTSLVVQYEVAGHTQNGKTWATDTIVSVDDDVGDIHEDMWVMGVNFTKDVHAGTRTTLNLIRPWTLQF